MKDIIRFLGYFFMFLIVTFLVSFAYFWYHQEQVVKRMCCRWRHRKRVPEYWLRAVPFGGKAEKILSYLPAFFVG